MKDSTSPLRQQQQELALSLGVKEGGEEMFPGMRNRSLKGGLQSQVLTASWWGQGRRQENNTLTLCSSCLHIFCRSLSWAKPERPDMM